MPIRVLMVSTSYPSSEGDWKGLFIRRLVEALARRDDIALQLWSPSGPLPTNVLADLSSAEQHWLEQLMQDGGIAHLLRNKPAIGVMRSLRLLHYLRGVYLRNADASVYHVNWLQNAIALPRNGCPVLLTALGSDMQLLRLPGIKSTLRRVFRHRSVTICPNAEWMVGPLRRAFGDTAHIQYVPFGIDPLWFELPRRIMDAPASRWLAVTRLTKGKLGTLFEWCEPLFHNQARELHLFGPMQEETEIPDWVHYHGPATPEELSACWFPQAHGLITLSKHAEGRPQVMLEAMAAGLPIVASHLPAHIDLLRHQETGWLCGTPDELAKGITALSAPETNLAIGLKAREWASAQIGTWDDCAARYASIYHHLEQHRQRIA